MPQLIILKFALAGALLGLTAGISPGPLLTLVITETLKNNKKAGIKVALSPLITDLPIILITLLILSRLAQSDIALGIISFLGGIFVAWLGYESVTTKGLDISATGIGSQSLKKGIIANFLNPHPFLFWTAIGVPYMLKAYEESLMTVVVFLISFYVLLVGSKIVVAIITAKSKALINQKAYIMIMRILGITLLGFSVMFFYDGFKYLTGTAP